MSVSSPSTGTREVPLWICILLGIVFIVAGILVLGDVAVATLISAVFIGVCAIVAGAFEIGHAFWTKGWGGFFWHILLGLLYVAFGIALLRQPVAGAMILTWIFGVFLLASGLVRLYIGFRHWAEWGWLLFLSGVFGAVAGVMILAGWPATGLWVIGFFLGVDLVFHGVGWLVLAWRPAARISGQPSSA